MGKVRRRDRYNFWRRRGSDQDFRVTGCVESGCAEYPIGTWWDLELYIHPCPGCPDNLVWRELIITPLCLELNLNIDFTESGQAWGHDWTRRTTLSCNGTPAYLFPTRRYLYEASIGGFVDCFPQGYITGEHFGYLFNPYLFCQKPVPIAAHGVWTNNGASGEFDLPLYISANLVCWQGVPRWVFKFVLTWQEVSWPACLPAWAMGPELPFDSEDVADLASSRGQWLSILTQEQVFGVPLGAQCENSYQDILSGGGQIRYRCMTQAEMEETECCCRFIGAWQTGVPSTIGECFADGGWPETCDTCEDIDDPFGACCLPDNSCIETTQGDCADRQGRWMGPVDCSEVDCTSPVRIGMFVRLLPTVVSHVIESFEEITYGTCPPAQNYKVESIFGPDCMLIGPDWMSVAQIVSGQLQPFPFYDPSGTYRTINVGAGILPAYVRYYPESRTLSIWCFGRFICVPNRANCSMLVSDDLLIATACDPCQVATQSVPRGEQVDQGPPNTYLMPFVQGQHETCNSYTNAEKDAARVSQAVDFGFSTGAGGKWKCEIAIGDIEIPANKTVNQWVSELTGAAIKALVSTDPHPYTCEIWGSGGGLVRQGTWAVPGPPDVMGEAFRLHSWPGVLLSSQQADGNLWPLGQALYTGSLWTLSKTIHRGSTRNLVVSGCTHQSAYDIWSDQTVTAALVNLV